MSKYLLSYDEEDVKAGKLQVDSEGVLKSAGVKSWDELEGRPFYEEKNSIICGVYDRGPDYYRGFYVKSANRHKSYTFVIRGDVFENVEPYETSNYYNHVQWGIEGWSNDYTEDTPFKFWREPAYFDENGDFVPSRGTANAVDPDEHGHGVIHFEADPERYPNLTLDEVEIYEVSLIPIDEKYLPQSVKGGYDIIFNMEAASGSRWRCNKTYEECFDLMQREKPIKAVAVIFTFDDANNMLTVARADLTEFSLRYDDMAIEFYTFGSSSFGGENNPFIVYGTDQTLNGISQ